MSLEARGVTFAYVAGHPVLSDIQLTVEPGERVALVAPSGRGKTTLCQLLAGYLNPQRGEVLVDGVSVLCRARGPRPVQLIAQHPEQAFDPLVRMKQSLAEGVTALSHGTRRRRRMVLEDIRATSLIERFGIRDAWLERYPHELSGGELMRFCIVRALLAHPRYLICDEMTAMLDAVTQADLWRAVCTIADEQRMGLVFVSHSPALVDRLATRRVVI